MERNPNSLDIEKLGLAVLPAFKNEVNLYSNINVQDQESQSMNSILEPVLLRIALEYFEKKNIIPIFIEGPNKKKINVTEKEEPYLFKKITLENVLKDVEYVKRFYHDDKSLFAYAYDNNTGILKGNRVSTNGINLISAYFKSPRLNVNNIGERLTLSSTKEGCNRDLYVYGSCLSFGLFADDLNTFPSYLQALINSNSSIQINVHNLGVKGRNCLLNDLLFALNTPLHKGDVVVFVNLYPAPCRQIIENTKVNSHKLTIYNFSSYLNDTSTPKNCFLNSTFHCNQIIYKKLADFTFQILQSVNPTFPKTKGEETFSYLLDSKKLHLIDTDRLLNDLFVGELLQRSREMAFPHSEGNIIGSLVMAANPFTNGHAQLVDFVANECDFFYVFIIEDPHFEFSFAQRLEMTEKYVKKYPHGKVIPTGNYFGADFLFPEYHDRSLYNSSKISNPQIDTIIFARHLAPLLGINRRYLGSEEFDPVTQQFNDYLKAVLPEYGINVYVIPRFNTAKNKTITGTHVRELLRHNPMSFELFDYLPSSTIDVIRHISMSRD